MNQGVRLREERERLGYSQTAFAAIAGASKHSQINWEKGVASPNMSALEAWAAVGLDVLYVVLGQRSLPSSPTLATSDAPVSEPPVVAESKALKEAMKIANELPEDVHRDILEHVKGRRRDTEREQALQNELERLGGGSGKRSA